MKDTRPSWMEGGTAKQRRPPAPGTRLLHVEEVDRSGTRPTTHRDVVVGVVILAVLALLQTFFWFGFALTLIIAPSHGGALADGWRLAVSAAVAIAGSVLAWKAADGLVA